MPYQYQNQIPGLPAAIAPQGLPAGAAVPQLPSIPQVAPAAPQASALDQFLGNISNPAGNSQFLLDLGARLLQPRAKGSSPLGAIASAGSQAVGGLTARKAAAGKGALDTQLAQSRLATEELQRTKLGTDITGAEQAQKAAIAGQPLQDRLTESTIAKNLREAKASGTTAATVQQAEAYGKVLFANNPEKYGTLDKATEDAYKQFQPVGKDPDAWYASALAKYDAEAALSGANPKQIAAHKEELGRIRDAWKYGPEGAPKPEMSEAVKLSLKGLKAGVQPGPEEIQAIVQHFKSISGSDAEARQLFKDAIGEGGNAQATTPAVSEQAVQESLVSFPEETPDYPPSTKAEQKRSQIKEKKAAKQANAEEIRKLVLELNNKVPAMTATEAQVFLDKNEGKLTPAQVRRIKAIIKGKRRN